MVSSAENCSFSHRPRMAMRSGIKGDEILMKEVEKMKQFSKHVIMSFTIIALQREFLFSEMYQFNG